mmetsp:Transcript_1564/g.2956  ORF Transcript_1564/g.2956 Transcript_1564/m.2956 type:complete len:208 (-) Transcript_1564:13-636(-)
MALTIASTQGAVFAPRVSRTSVAAPQVTLQQQPAGMVSFMGGIPVPTNPMQMSPTPMAMAPLPTAPPVELADAYISSTLPTPPVIPNDPNNLFAAGQVVSQQNVTIEELAAEGRYREEEGPPVAVASRHLPGVQQPQMVPQPVMTTPQRFGISMPGVAPMTVQMPLAAQPPQQQVLYNGRMQPCVSGISGPISTQYGQPVLYQHVVP